ncbi:GNAT family N-acetyltransferase [Streptomyces cyaneofuscatus]|uniref:GNAT family N-acetyltransferase n=1 Tax=Streptomyces cyaneofuscatus TaxID=66883 RepID=UPI00342F5B45
MPDPNGHRASAAPYAPYLAEGPRTALRRFTEADAAEFTARARESRALHRPWLFPPERTDTYAAYTGTLARDPAREGFLICERGEEGEGGVDGAIAGFININNIVLGGFRSGALGYGAFAHAAGRGLMGEALGLVMDLAFGPLGLHRLEANIQPGNAASIALVRRAGFRLEGFSPDFLHIDGAWRDHERWAITAPAAEDSWSTRAECA